MSSPTHQYKAFARSYLRRRRLSGDLQKNLRDAYTSHLSRLWENLAPASSLAAFLPLPSEPPIVAGLADAHERGHQILVPVICPEQQLNWVRWTPTSSLSYNSLGIGEPSGKRLSAQSFIEADLRLIPALAYDLHGKRLGQGGGYYDRLLAQLSAHQLGSSTIGVVFDHEILDGLPCNSWDASLNYVLTEEGIRQLGKNQRNRVQ